MISRRSFLGSAGASTLIASGLRTSAAQESERRPRLAMITTQWRYLLHAQHMGDRFLVGYPHAGRWRQPAVDLVSLYVDQRTADDQCDARAREFGFTIYPTIAEALTRGKERLDVDAVLIIGEHGDYPTNEKGQILYPRYRFFKDVTDVFRRSKRAVPVFNDKHLSYRFDQALEMVQTAETMGFPLMAGSSLPVTWRLPSVDMPAEAEIDEALMVGCGSSDAMDYHALEAMQCLVERRRGGETGVARVRLIEGDAVWEAQRRGEWSESLLEAALSRSNQLLGKSRSEAKPQDLLGSGELQRLVTEPAAYQITYRDGLKATLLMLNGAVADYTFAARLNRPEQVVSTLFYLPPTPNVVYSAELMHHVETLFVTGQPQTPVKRTLLVSGMLESCLDSKARGHRVVETPHLDVAYADTFPRHYATL